MIKRNLNEEYILKYQKLVEDYDEVYPGYGFGGHKGYGTAAHYKAIRELGMCPIHRRSFLKVIH